MLEHAAIEIYLHVLLCVYVRVGWGGDKCVVLEHAAVEIYLHVLVSQRVMG